MAQHKQKKFKDLSSPEKCWVLTHPFKAKRALRISIEAQKTSDSIKKTNTLDQDGNGGQVDAFRHAYWMASLSKEIGKKSAKSLGKAHEKGNHKQFKKNELEDRIIPDEASSEMDLYNNLIGIELYTKNKNASRIELIHLVIENIKQGKMKIIKKDSYGNYQDCEGKQINLKQYKGHWSNPKCLVDSNEKKL